MQYTSEENKADPFMQYKSEENETDPPEFLTDIMISDKISRTETDTFSSSPVTSRYRTAPRILDILPSCVIIPQNQYPTDQSKLTKLRECATDGLVNSFDLIPLDNSLMQILSNYNLTMRVREYSRYLPDLRSCESWLWPWSSINHLVSPKKRNTSTHCCPSMPYLSPRTDSSHHYIYRATDTPPPLLPWDFDTGWEDVSPQIPPNHRLLHIPELHYGPDFSVVKHHSTLYGAVTTPFLSTYTMLRAGYCHVKASKLSNYVSDLCLLLNNPASMPIIVDYGTTFGASPFKEDLIPGTVQIVNKSAKNLSRHSQITTK